MTGMVFIFLLYLCATMTLGLWQARKTSSQADFVLGSSKLPGWMLALSERATGESAWLFIGLSGMVYSQGLSAVWICVGCLAGIVFSWVVLARRLRQEAERYQALTMPQYFAARFPAQARTIQALSTLVIVFFFVFYVGAQFAGAGKTCFQTFGLPPVWGQVIAAAVIMAYAAPGGFVSVVAVDAMQSVLMLFTLVVTPAIMLLGVLQSPVAFWPALAAAGPGTTSLTGVLTGLPAGLLIFNHFAWFFGYLGGQPQLNARFMGMADDRQVAIGRTVAIAWTVLAYGGVMVTGLCAIVLFGPNAVADPELILPHALLQLFPWWLAALLLAGVVAAMVSTAESMLLVAAASISHDLYGGLLKRGQAVPDATLLRVSRVATVAVGLLGLLLSLTSTDLVYQIVGYAWAGIGCSFAPAVLLTFSWERFDGRGVVAALAAGLLTTVLWIGLGYETVVTSRAVSFFVALLAAVSVTLVAGDRRPTTLKG